MQTRFTVDAAHCQKAADELYAMIFQQDSQFTERWRNSPLSKGVFNIARWIGLIFSLIGVALTLAFMVFGTPSWSTSTNPWFILVFLIFFVGFYLLPKLLPAVENWTRGMREKSCRRHAERCVRAARRLAPFEAQFELKGDLLIYTRGQADQWKLAWHRHLGRYQKRGMALQGTHVTAIFRRPTSFSPSIVILQNGPEWVADAIRQVGIVLKKV